MICYNVFLRVHGTGNGILIGAVPERRSDERTGGNPDLLGGLRYARQTFGGFVRNPDDIFVEATTVDSRMESE